MRYSIASQAICGAITVSALAVPSTLQRRTELCDISEFKSFPVADPQQYLDKADNYVREFFKAGMFDDGPMDKSGKWIDRPLATLEQVGDKLELKFEKLQEKLEDLQEKLEDQFEDIHSEVGSPVKAVMGGFVGGFLRGLGGQLKSRIGGVSRTKQFPDWNDILGTTKQNTQAQEVPQEFSPSSSSTSTSSQAATTQTTHSSTSTSTSTSSTRSAISKPMQAPRKTCDPSNSHVRFEWDNYTKSDRTAFVKAIKCLQDKPSGGSQFTGSRNRYEDLISVHRGMTGNVHQTSTFLVWHRYFVWVFEQMLREECAFDRAMPWWDETKHAGNFAASDVFTDEWFGHLPAKRSDGQGTCIVSGEFAGTTLHVGPGNNNVNHCLSRAVDETQTAQCNKDFTNSCLAMTTFDEFRDCFELGPHGYGHNGIGAVMAEVSASVGDPIFFMHHLFVDHTFRIWQNANPSRRTSISGCADAKSPCTPITLDTKLSSNGLAPDLEVRDVLNTLSGTVCYRYNY